MMSWGQTLKSRLDAVGWLKRQPSYKYHKTTHLFKSTKPNLKPYIIVILVYLCELERRPRNFFYFKKEREKSGQNEGKILKKERGRVLRQIWLGVSVFMWSKGVKGVFD